MIYGIWRAHGSTKPMHGATSLKCRSTNCKHKAQQFIQLRYGPPENDQKLIIGYCKKHKHTVEFIMRKWSVGGWTFERFTDKNEVLVDEIMRS